MDPVLDATGDPGGGSVAVEPWIGFDVESRRGLGTAGGSLLMPFSSYLQHQILSARVSHLALIEVRFIRRHNYGQTRYVHQSRNMLINFS